MFGEGDPDAELALVGEAPGFHEDRERPPFAGRSRELLARLLAGIGLALDEVYLATALKCRTPGAGTRLRGDRCMRSLPLPPAGAGPAPRRREPRELRDDAALRACAGDHPHHGEEQEVTLGGRSVTLVPLYHPAAALYTPTMLEVLERDIARLGEILGRARVEPSLAARADRDHRPVSREPAQLGLF